MSRTKTDRKDAEMISRYGTTETPGLWTPRSAGNAELRLMQSTLELFDKQRTALKNHRHALEHNPVGSKPSLDAIDKALAALDEQIAALEKSIAGGAKKTYSKELSLLVSIPGIGKKTATALLTVTDGFTRFKDSKALLCYFGLCPRIFESGTSVKGKSHITKMGMGWIRKLLYLCSWSAKGYNKGCKDLYERLLSKGKEKMVALIAVAGKLVRQAFAVVKGNKKYTPDYVYARQPINPKQPLSAAQPA